ncbi:transmembrane protein [Anaeramoeba flamelloides]|uniref:Transmembrane protein n=1 Tax=Anaeramoeba flamelloides TaxID=1746091 RepID=A0AAV7ZC91_9EUKA|nr:transmembrane protein [Anaeramoeba flamelloides]
MEENNNKLIYKFEFWCESNNILNSLGFFFGLFLFSLAVGGFGPSSLNSKTESFHIDNNTDTSDNTFIITGLTKLNQFLFVSAYFHNNRDYGIFSEVGYETRLFGSNNLNKNHQSTIANWKQITSSNHSRTIECKCEFLNLDLMYFEIIFRYIFVVVTIVFMVYLVRVTKGIAFKEFTLPQKLISILLILLLLKNNPIYPAILLDNKNVIKIFDFIFLTTFRVFLLVFWLIFFEGFVENYSKKPFLKYYLPRILPLFLMWIIIIILNFVVIAEESKDPLLDQDSDIRGFRGFHIFVDIVLIGYCVWTVLATINAIKLLIIQLKNGNWKNSYARMKGYSYILLFSYFILIFGNVIYFKKFLPKFTSSSLEFLLIYTLDTGYVLFLAVAFLPINITINFRNNTNDQLKQEEGRHKPLNQDSKNRSESGYGLENNQIGIINEKRDHSKKPIGDGEISSEIEPSDLEYGNGNHEKNRKLKKEEFIVKKDSENEEIEKGGLLSSENSEN